MKPIDAESTPIP